MSEELGITVTRGQLSLTQKIKEILDSEQIDHNLVQDLFKGQDIALASFIKLGGQVTNAIRLALYNQKKIWEFLALEDIQQLWSEDPWCPEEKFNYSFECYAQSRTGLQWVTIANWVRTAAVWLSGEFAKNIPEKTIVINHKTGEIIEEEKKFDPWLVDPSKLQLVNVKLARGEVDETLWGLLANPEATFTVIQRYVQLNEKPWEPQIIPEKLNQFMYVEGGLLYAQERGFEPEVVAKLEWDAESEIIQWALKRIVERSGIYVRG